MVELLLEAGANLHVASGRKVCQPYAVNPLLTCFTCVAHPMGAALLVCAVR